jgi:hypothetical protein
LLVGLGMGWSLGLLFAAALSLGFGIAFWWCWDAWQEHRRQGALTAPIAWWPSLTA